MDTKPNDEQRPSADAAWFATLAEPGVDAEPASDIAGQPDNEGAAPPAVADNASPGAGDEPVSVMSATAPYLPPLDRQRPERMPLVHRWVLIAVAGAFALALAVGGSVAVVGALRQVTVPDVVGSSVDQAEKALQSVGLTTEISERRFSTEVEGTVLQQDPGAGTELGRGETVKLVVSAGTEDFAMPDVIGSQVASATEALRAKGLVITVETFISDAPSDTVLASTPAPGSPVRTGDNVVLQVAASTAPGVVLQPYSLVGVSITVDAAPQTAGAADISLEVARRLGALLEASGATVTMLRSTGDTSTTDAERAARAAEATSTLAVGFGLSPEAAAGRVTQYPSQGTAQAIASANLLASAITSELASAAPPSSSLAAPSDPVLSTTPVAWVRVLLGSQSAREDQTLFADPGWADKVARAVYTAVGKTYGVAQQP